MLDPQLFTNIKEGVINQETYEGEMIGKKKMADGATNKGEI